MRRSGRWWALQAVRAANEWLLWSHSSQDGHEGYARMAGTVNDGTNCAASIESAWLGNSVSTLSLKFDVLLWSLERRYRLDQPRMPKGTPEGGQWADASSASLPGTIQDSIAPFVGMAPNGFHETRHQPDH